VDLLETTIYDQAALFFGVHVHQKATTLLGKSRRVQNSINLVVSKNLLTKELETILDPEARTLITTRLNYSVGARRTGKTVGKERRLFPSSLRIRSRGWEKHSRSKMYCKSLSVSRTNGFSQIQHSYRPKSLAPPAFFRRSTRLS